jgi:hypothetical protein
MPAKDRYHDTVVRALQKDGWTIEKEQVKYVMAGRRIWIDIRASKASQEMIILVEVKGFENMLSPIDFLASAIGKFVLYQTALYSLKINIPLYMAVPEAAYNGILSEEIGKQVIRHANIQLIVFDPMSEEIVRWIPNI